MHRCAKILELLLALALLPGCASPPASTITATAAATSFIQTAAPLPVISSAPATATEPAPLPSLTPTHAPRICSPLQDQPLSQMSSLISNPFHPPAPGSDQPHQGVDLAIRAANSQVATAGNPVLAALSGKVAMVTRDRFPFGNAVIIETVLEGSSADWWATAELPTPAPTLVQHSALTCPAGPAPTFANPAHRSLYILYAHLLKPADLKIDDQVGCGEPMGDVGSSGNALNPHLHFETKVGPSGLRMESMAHYDASATTEEMSNYCLWSISGLFQLVDPLKVLQLAP